MNPSMNPRLWEARRAKDLSQQELAELVGVTRKDIGLIESEGWIPPLEVRVGLAKVLKVPVDTLFPLGGDRAS